MAHFAVWSPSENERENILTQHKELYNGYQTLNPAAMEKIQPLYTQDFANDKEGLVVNNKGEVKAYTNMGINESKKRKSYVETDKEMCEQCSSNKSLEEDFEDGEVASDVEPAYEFQSHGPEDVYGTLDDYDSEHPHHDYNSMEDVERTALPRLVCKSTPVALITRVIAWLAGMQRRMTSLQMDSESVSGVSPALIRCRVSSITCRMIDVSCT